LTVRVWQRGPRVIPELETGPVAFRWLKHFARSGQGRKPRPTRRQKQSKLRAISPHLPS